LIPIMIGITSLLVLLIFTIGPLRRFFQFGIPDPKEIAVCIITGFLSVIWFEVFKFVKRVRT
ncbi:MAG: hypothetical protein C0490_19715, partial [Marivirga sp.]|nr:hypothetical protein [Marivirga sp.]